MKNSNSKTFLFQGTIIVSIAILVLYLMAFTSSAGQFGHLNGIGERILDIKCTLGNQATNYCHLQPSKPPENPDPPTSIKDRPSGQIIKKTNEDPPHISTKGASFDTVIIHYYSEGKPDSQIFKREEYTRLLYSAINGHKDSEIINGMVDLLIPVDNIEFPTTDPPEEQLSHMATINQKPVGITLLTTNKESSKKFNNKTKKLQYVLVSCDLRDIHGQNSLELFVGNPIPIHIPFYFNYNVDSNKNVLLIPNSR